MRVIKPNWVEHAAGELIDDFQADVQARRRRRVPSTPSPCIPMGRDWRLVAKVGFQLLLRCSSADMNLSNCTASTMLSSPPCPANR